jgi:hypothetical protein
MPMDFADTYSLRRIIKQSYCPSRVHRLVFLAEAGPLVKRTRSTTICCLVAVVPGLTGHGQRFVDAIEVDGSATKIAWSMR